MAKMIKIEKGKCGKEFVTGLICLICGNTINRKFYLADLKLGKGKYCSVICYKQWLAISQKGENNTYWRGGKSISSGYVFISKPDYYRAGAKGRVKEHIYNWEVFHGKRLPFGYEIHHINGITTDNRPENLMAMKTSEHQRMHALKRWERIKAPKEKKND